MPPAPPPWEPRTLSERDSTILIWVSWAPHHAGKPVPVPLFCGAGRTIRPGPAAPRPSRHGPPGTVQPRPHTPFRLLGPGSQASALLPGWPPRWLWWPTTHLRMLEAAVRRKSSERTHGLATLPAPGTRDLGQRQPSSASRPHGPWPPPARPHHPGGAVRSASARTSGIDLLPLPLRRWESSPPPTAGPPCLSPALPRPLRDTPLGCRSACPCSLPRTRGQKPPVDPLGPSPSQEPLRAFLGRLASRAAGVDGQKGPATHTWPRRLLWVPQTQALRPVSPNSTPTHALWGAYKKFQYPLAKTKPKPAPCSSQWGPHWPGPQLLPP